MKVPRCKGTQDLPPDDMVKFRHIEEIFRTCCLQWGYQEIRTPTLEYLHLFTSAGTLTPGMLGKVYSFLDWNGWSGERVVLRPDGTIPTARLYVDSFQHCPIARLFYVENIFAFEGTGQESRERWQCGAELIGSARPQGDAELILLAVEVLGKLGVDHLEVRLSHAGLIKSLLKELGLEAEEQDEMFERILEGNLEALGKVKGKVPDLERYLSLLLSLEGKSYAFLENLRGVFSKSFPRLEPSFDNLRSVAELLSAMGCNYQINIASGKGFEYYTGVIFQFYRLGHRLGGGGRYDELVSLIGGKAAPASGFALYVDELIKLIRPDDLRPTLEERILVRGKAGTVEEYKSCFEIANLLRRAGYVTEMDMGLPDKVDFRWILSVRMRDKEPVFDLRDQASGERLQGASAEILKRLEEAKCR